LSFRRAGRPLDSWRDAGATVVSLTGEDARRSILLPTED